MKNEKLKFIQIGTGGFGGAWCKNHLPPIIKDGNAEIIAAVDLNPEAHNNAIEFLGLDRNQCYTNIREALAENQCDFVNIVVPPFAHEEVVNLALEYNCHILMEKPIAENMEASCRIFHKVKQAGKKMAITVSHSFDQDKQTLLALIKSKQYGKLNYLIGRFTTNFRAETSDPKAYAHQNFLISSAVHHFDIIRSLTGSNAKTVNTLSWNPDWAQFKEHGTALVLMEMENGARAFYEGSKSNATHLYGWGNDFFRAECEEGTIELDRREINVKSDLGFPNPVTSKIPLLKQKYWTHTWLLNQFINWINGSEAPRNTLDDNIQTTALQFAAIESGFTGRVIDVQDFLERYLKKSKPIV